jgi:DNA (cytosine-5)-methyltransferase 1
MIHIGLFEGIGGFSIASSYMGWDTLSTCEINPFGRRVLEYYWPNAYHHDDIHTLTFNKINDELTKRSGPQWRSDDIVLTGGFPCQPYSLAGKRKGKDDSRHLWPEMLRIIREVQPTWIVGENVYGLVNWNEGLVFEEVSIDLENEGYQVQPYILPAVSVGSVHRRDRVWFVAHSNNTRLERKTSKRVQTGKERRNRVFNGESAWMGSETDWLNFPTQSPVRNGNDGIPDRMVDITVPRWRKESLMALGNAIVPQVAIQLFKTIEQYNTLTSSSLKQELSSQPLL